MQRAKCEKTEGGDDVVSLVHVCIVILGRWERLCILVLRNAGYYTGYAILPIYLVLSLTSTTPLSIDTKKKKQLSFAVVLEWYSCLADLLLNSSVFATYQYRTLDLAGCSLQILREIESCSMHEFGIAVALVKDTRQKPHDASLLLRRSSLFIVAIRRFLPCQDRRWQWRVRLDRPESNDRLVVRPAE